MIGFGGCSTQATLFIYIYIGYCGILWDIMGAQETRIWVMASVHFDQSPGGGLNDLAKPRNTQGHVGSWQRGHTHLEPSARERMLATKNR